MGRSRCKLTLLAASAMMHSSQVMVGVGRSQVALTSSDQKLLWTRAHNRCSFPSCRQPLTEDQVDAATGDVFFTVVGEEAHIRSASVNGPRYDHNYPAEKIETYENRILLCPAHHTRVDAQLGRGYAASTLLEMKRKHEKLESRREGLDTAVRHYLNDQFNADDPVRFRQVLLDGPSVDSMFVDVPFACRDSDPVAELLKRIADGRPGDAVASPGFVVTGAAQALLHPEWVGHALLVGGPGQGKSTLLQYLCQFHRGRRLERTGYTGDAQGLRPVTETSRVAVRIDLRDYAAWAAPTGGSGAAKKKGRRRPKPEADAEWRSIEQYIAKHIEQRSGGHTFSVEDLAVLLATEPVLLALDGLDEVADLDDRRNVGDQVMRTTTRLDPEAMDLVVLVATRPGLTVSSLWSTPKFATCYLQRLTAGLRLQYLRRWCEVAHLTTTTARRLETTFLEHENLPHIRDLASYPMQLAILLHLLHQRGLLPQQRTELYAEFLKTFLDREETEDKEPLVACYRSVIVDVHAYIGWQLQLRAEDDRATGSISRDDLNSLLVAHLRGREKGDELAVMLLEAIEGRVLCLLEREPGYFEFEVQSLREYFAALYVNDYAPRRGAGNSREDCFDALLVRPYWLNVARFFVGMVSNWEVRGIGQGLRQLATGPELGRHPLLRSAAARLLDDRAFQRQSDATVSEVVDFILDGPGVVLANDGFLDESEQPLTLPEDAGRSQVLRHLQRRLCERGTSEGTRHAAARLAQRHTDETTDLAAWWWQKFEPTESWLRTACDVGALAEVPVGSETKLATAVAAETEACWPVELLGLGGYSDHHDDVLTTCVSQLNDGAADVVETDLATPLGRLIDVALVAQGRFRPSHPPSERRTRYRGAAGRAVLTQYLASADALRLSPASTAGDQDWFDRLRQVGEVWGDGWVLRQAAALIPATVDLRSLGRNESAIFADVWRAESDYRANRGDSGWWRQASAAAITSLDRRAWLFAVITTAQTAVVTGLSKEIDAAVSELSPRHYRSMEAAVAAFARTARRRDLLLHDALRRGIASFTARTLWLLRLTCSTPGVEQIDRKLGASFVDLLDAGMGDRREVLRAVRSKVQPAWLHGTRETLPDGWLAVVRLGALSNATANQVLEKPEDWPREIVSISVQHVSARIARQPSVSQLEHENHWFQAD